jgi:hypothetical protein
MGSTRSLQLVAGRRVLLRAARGAPAQLAERGSVDQLLVERATEKRDDDLHDVTRDVLRPANRSIPASGRSPNSAVKRLRAPRASAMLDDLNCRPCLVRSAPDSMRARRSAAYSPHLIRSPAGSIRSALCRSRRCRDRYGTPTSCALSCSRRQPPLLRSESRGSTTTRPDATPAATRASTPSGYASRTRRRGAATPRLGHQRCRRARLSIPAIPTAGGQDGHDPHRRRDGHGGKPVLG